MDRSLSVVVAAAALGLAACTSGPLVRYSTDTPPMIMTPVSRAGLTDGRARFREIFCAIARQRGSELPDNRPCGDALVSLSDEPSPSGRAVPLGHSDSPLRIGIVYGLGWSCLKGFVDPEAALFRNTAQFGYEVSVLGVEALSGSGRNAGLIRDAIVAMDREGDARPLVLIGYSKGTPDILEAIVNYPEIQPRVAAVVSIAGAVGGSPLVYDTSQSTVNLLKHFPGSQCGDGDEGALESLRPDVRQRWIARHPLPESIRYYSLIAYPGPGRISTALKPTYRKLARIDARNDGQILSYDQVIPGGTVLGYLDADHWAVYVPIARSSKFIGATFVDKNEFPREVMMEAIGRFVEEDLSMWPESATGSSRARRGSLVGRPGR